jgi:hypothetical protein
MHMHMRMHIHKQRAATAGKASRATSWGSLRATLTLKPLTLRSQCIV